LRTRAGRSGERPRTDPRAREEAEEEDPGESAERGENSSPLRPKSQQKQPQLDLFANLIFHSALQVCEYHIFIIKISNAEDVHPREHGDLLQQLHLLQLTQKGTHN
jgi:hypothetical protein